MAEENMAHPDEAQDQAQIDANLQQLIQELTPVLDMLMGKIQEQEQKIAQLEETLYDKMIGGLTSAKRASDVMGLKERHGGKFDELLKYYQGVHGADPEQFYDGLLDHIGGGDEDSAIVALLERMTGERDAHKALLMGGEPEAAVKVEAAGEPEAVQQAAEEVPAAVEKATEKAKEVKEEKPAVGSKEYYKRIKGKGAPSSKAQS